MPKLEKPIPETDQLVVRAVALGVIQEIMVDRMGLPANTRVTFPGYSETVALPKGLISSPYEDTRLPTDGKITVEVTEEYVKDWLPAAATKNSEHIPLFQNNDLEVVMRPIYASVEMRINIVYRSANKTDARRFYDYMMMKLPNREDTWMHTVQYSFGMPDAFLEILKEIHRLTEVQAGYGEDFETFFVKWTNPRYGILTDQVGKNTLGVFSETVSNVMGFFDIDAVPDFGSKKDDTDTWEVELPYVIRYEKPKDIYFSYPIVIHNSVLGKRYRGTTGFQRTEDFQQSRPMTLRNLHSFEAMQNVKSPMRNFPGRYFPLYDEFMPRHVPEKTMRVFTTLVLLANDDDPDPLHLMNIADLEGPQYGMKLNDAIKDYLRAEHQYLTTPQMSAMHIGLYQGRHMLEDSFIEVDENLNIRSTKPLNKRRYYHIRLSIVTDLTYLTDKAKHRLMRFPLALTNFIEYITPEGTQIPYFEVVDGVIPGYYFDAIADWLKGSKQTIKMKTAQNAKINAVYITKR